MEKYDVVVLDSSSIIRHQQLHNVASRIVTVPEVLEELKSSHSQLHLQLLPQEVQIISASEENIKQRDLKSLSSVDIKVLALVLEMERLYCSASHIRSSPIIPKVVKESAPTTHVKAPGFYNGKKSTEEFCEEDDWITPTNISSIGSVEGGVENSKSSSVAKVACAVSDFAMQNVLMHMGLHVTSVDGYLITKIQSYINKCTTCSKIEPDVTKEFCNNCGYRRLRKVAFTLSPDGSILCQQKLRPEIKEDISKYCTLNAIKKYGDPIYCEEQLKKKRENNRIKKSKIRCDDQGMSVFAVRDTTSRAFQKGFYLSRNTKF